MLTVQYTYFLSAPLDSWGKASKACLKLELQWKHHMHFSPDMKCIYHSLTLWLHTDILQNLHDAFTSLNQHLNLRCWNGSKKKWIELAMGSDRFPIWIYCRAFWDGLETRWTLETDNKSICLNIVAVRVYRRKDCPWGSLVFKTSRALEIIIHF